MPGSHPIRERRVLGAVFLPRLFEEIHEIKAITVRSGAHGDHPDMNRKGRACESFVEQRAQAW